MQRNRGLALVGAAALALVTSGCQVTGQQGGKSDAGAVKSAIKADETKWNAEFKNKDQESLVGHYADDAYFVAPGVAPADGSMAIRKAYADGLSDPNFAISFSSSKIDSGDLAYSRGRFTEKYTDPKTGKVISDAGSYITVYKKQADGSWKAVEDFAVGDPGAAKPVEPGKPATPAKMVSF
jgi:ketosteroid isomerase-like protein